MSRGGECAAIIKSKEKAGGTAKRQRQRDVVQLGGAGDRTPARKGGWSPCKRKRKFAVAG